MTAVLGRLDVGKSVGKMSLAKKPTAQHTLDWEGAPQNPLENSIVIVHRNVNTFSVGYLFLRKRNSNFTMQGGKIYRPNVNILKL